MIEIHLDGNPVSKLEAAQALSVVSSRRVYIGEPDENGYIYRGSVQLRARYWAYGEVQPPQVNWPSGAGDAPEARDFAGMLTLAAEIADLAQMIGAGQDALAREASRSGEGEA